MSRRIVQISRNVILLGVVSLLSDMSSELYFAILPFFILEIGGNSLAIGVIAGVTDGFVSFLKAYFGLLADKLKAARKRYIYWGYGLPAFFKLLMATARSWPIFLFYRLFERFGKGIRTAPRDALIAESSEKRFIGRNFGFHRAMDSLGAFLGSLLSLILISVFFLSYRQIIFLSGILGFLTLIPILFVNDKESSSETKITHGLSEFLKEGKKDGYWKVTLVTSLHGLSLVSYMFFILLSGKIDILGLGLTPAETGVIFYIYFNLIYTLTSYGAGSLSDSIGKIHTLRIGFFLYATSLLVFMIGGGIVGMILAFTFYGVAYGFNEGNLRALPDKYIKEDFKPSGYGIFHGIFGLSIFTGNIIAGTLLDVNPTLMIPIALTFSVTSIIALTLIDTGSHSESIEREN